MATVNIMSDNEPDALAVVLDGRAQQRSICRHLEGLADSLQTDMDRALLLPFLRDLHHDLTVHHRDEEALYGLLQAELGDPIVSRWAELAAADHSRHREYAFELGDAFSCFMSGERDPSRNELGYIVRCTFENMRQHLDWEETTLVHRVHEVMSTRMNFELTARLAANRRDQPLRLRLRLVE